LVGFVAAGRGAVDAGLITVVALISLLGVGLRGYRLLEYAAKLVGVFLQNFKNIGGRRVWFLLGLRVAFAAATGLDDRI
jgi:hypothetical protein